MPKVQTGGTYCWELRKGTSLHVFQGGQPEVRQAAGAWNLGIWPISAGVRLTAQEHAEQKGHIAGNCERELLYMFCKVDNPKFANHIVGSEKCPQFRTALNSRSRG